MSAMRVSMPGIIQSFDPDAVTAVVQPAIKGVMGREILMATNDFKPFATGSGANVLSQADYEALSALASGFLSGKASSAQVNKALRQSSTICGLT